MDIILVYKEDFPWDVRVEKLAKTLTASGHAVTIISRNLGQRPTAECIGDIKIRRLPITRALPRIVQQLINLPFWFNPVWLWTLFKYSSGLDRGVIIVRDLPLVRTGLSIGKLRNAKVVFDMAECYPEMYASAAQFSKRTFFTRFLKNPKRASSYEASVVNKVDHTFVMIEESRDRLISLDVPENRISIVSNTPDPDKFQGVVHHHEGHTLRIVYVGFLSSLRGLDVLIRSVAQYLKNGNPPDSIQVDIVGKGAARDALISLCKELRLEESVHIHGWLEHEEVNKLMASSNVGALTYRVCGHWNHTIPNKIFDYMLAGIPVLATEIVPIRRILEETKSGIICKDQDTHDIAVALEALRDPLLRSELGANGNRSVIDHYNWNFDQERLLTAIDSLKSK